MNFEYPIRILSDLHIGHPASLVRDIEQIAPLLTGPRTVIFNGDTVEMRYRSERTRGEEDLAKLRQLCARLGVVPIFITGNHDPIVSTINHLDLPDLPLLITHGDILFYSISPWSHEAKYIAAAHDEAIAALDEDSLSSIEHRLHASKKAALALELHEPPVRHGPFAKLLTIAYQCWPPWRPLHIIRCWMLTPRRAAKLLLRFRPQKKFIAIGHTHYAGLWRRKGRTILNTGGFFPISRRRLIDLEGDLENDRLFFREIIERKDAFHVGKTLAELPLRD